MRKDYYFSFSTCLPGTNDISPTLFTVDTKFSEAIFRSRFFFILIEVITNMWICATRSKFVFVQVSTSINNSRDALSRNCWNSSGTAGSQVGHRTDLPSGREAPRKGHCYKNKWRFSACLWSVKLTEKGGGGAEEGNMNVGCAKHNAFPGQGGISHC